MPSFKYVVLCLHALIAAIIMMGFSHNVGFWRAISLCKAHKIDDSAPARRYSPMLIQEFYDFRGEATRGHAMPPRNFARDAHDGDIAALIARF